jgi:iron complex outermembrane receptor protein
MRRRLLIGTALSGVVLGGLTGAAPAADTESDSKDAGLENIIVTANKRAENLQTVPTSMSAVNEAQLKELGVTSTVGIAQFVPGVQVMAVNTGTDNFFSIRGATQNDYAEHEESPVAVYMDGVYLSQAAGTSALLFDTQRVEVLRGPQGTLFGRNATAGAVQFISKQPTDVPDGYVETSYGNYNANHTEGAYGQKIADGWSFRISAASDYIGPTLTNELSNGHNAGNNNSHALRLQVKYAPTDDLDATTNIHGTELRDRAGFYKWISVYPNPANHNLGSLVPANGNPWGTCNGCDILGYQVPPNTNYYTGSANVLGHNWEDTVGITETINYRLHGLNLTSISDMTHYTKDYTEDSDSTPQDIIQFWTGVNTGQMSQEVHLDNGGDGPVRWVVGAYYLQMNGRYREGNGFGTAYVTALGFPPDSPAAPAEEENYVIKTKSWSQFAQTEVDILQDLTATVGGRWATESKTFFYQENAQIGDRQYSQYDPTMAPFLINPALAGAAAKILKSDWSGKVALNWHITPDIMPYVSASRGLKSGGFNAPDSELFTAAGTPAYSQYKFGEEKIYAYELGTKTELFDHKVRLNGDVFYYDYVGYQAFNTQGVNTYITNNPAKMTGAELELTVKPYPNWTLHEGVAYLNAVIDSIALPDGTLENRQAVQAPKWDVTGDLVYDWPMPFGGDTALGVDYSYRTAQYFQLLNDPASRQNQYWLVNLHAEYTTEDGHWSARAYANNVTNTQYLVNSIISAGIGFGQGVYGAPPMFGMRLSYHI